MRDRVRGSLLLAASGLSFGSLTVLAKLAYAEGITIPSLLVVRFGVAALALLPAAILLAKAPRRFGPALLLGAVGYAGTTLLFFHALATLPAGVASFLLYLNPLLVALLARAVLGERLSPAAAWGLAAGLAGVAAIALAPEIALDPRGVFLALGSAFVYAATILAGRRVVETTSPWVVAAGACAGAAAAWVALGLAGGGLAAPPTAAAAGYAVAIALLCTAAALATFYLGLPLTGAPRAAIISMLEPASAVVLAALVLGEALTAIQLAGCGLVLLGVTLATR